MNNPKEYMYLDDKFYKSIKEVLEESRKRIYRNIQSEMVQAYWQIGKMIVEKQGGETLPIDNKQIYASKYMLYLPKEEDLQNEMNKQLRLLNEKKSI